LVNPPSGRNNVVVYNALDWVEAVGADYAGVDQTTPVNTAYFGAAPIGSLSVTVSVTPTLPNCWVVAGSSEFCSGYQAPSAGANLTQRAYGAAYGQPQICDSNGPEAASTNSYTTTTSVGTQTGAVIIGVAFAPASLYAGPTTGSLTLTQRNQTLSATATNGGAVAAGIAFVGAADLGNNGGSGTFTAS
jgi:hypothetical protein